MTSKQIKEQQGPPGYIQTTRKSWLSEIAYQLARLNEREDRRMEEWVNTSTNKKIVQDA